MPTPAARALAGDHVVLHVDVACRRSPRRRAAAGDSRARPRLVCSTTPVALITGRRVVARAGRRLHRGVRHLVGADLAGPGARLRGQHLRLDGGVTQPSGGVPEAGVGEQDVGPGHAPPRIGLRPTWDRACSRSSGPRRRSYGPSMAGPAQGRSGSAIGCWGVTRSPFSLARSGAKSFGHDRRSCAAAVCASRHLHRSVLGRADATRRVLAGRWAGQLQVPGDLGRGDGGGVALLVHDRVVPRAQQRHVGQVGRSAVAPVHAVMGVTPARWARAAREGAAAVTQAQRQEQLRGWPAGRSGPGPAARTSTRGRRG